MDVEQLVGIRRALLERGHPGIAGRIRTEQNWIGGEKVDYNLCGADFVPPPPEIVDSLLGDLCRFSSTEPTPPL